MMEEYGKVVALFIEMGDGSYVFAIADSIGVYPVMKFPQWGAFVHFCDGVVEARGVYQAKRDSEIPPVWREALEAPDS